MTVRLALVVLAFLCVCTGWSPHTLAQTDAEASARAADLSGEREVYIGTRLVTVRVDLWRNFMGPIPRHGPPLLATVSIRTRTPGGLPSGLHATSLSVRHAFRSWFARLALQDVGVGPYPASRFYTAGGGPRWPPAGTVVHCVVALRDGRRTTHVAIPVVINRVE